MESYLQRFLTLSRPKPASREPVPLAALMDNVFTLVRTACVHAGIDLSVVKPQTPLTVLGDADELRQLLLNLALNALDAVSGQEPPLKRIVLALEPGGADIRACASATAVPDQRRKSPRRLFEPFVTGKPEGTGLGLFVARQIAEDTTAARQAGSAARA